MVFSYFFSLGVELEAVEERQRPVSKERSQKSEKQTRFCRRRATTKGGRGQYGPILGRRASAATAACATVVDPLRAQRDVKSANESDRRCARNCVSWIDVFEIVI